jgi:hypothetical protein
MDKGGRIVITINGANYSARGSVSIMPARVERAAMANRDGSMATTVAAKLATAEISFDRNERLGLTWDDAMLNERVNVTIEEVDARVIHEFTAASWVGTPGLDTESGEISGMSIATDNYQRIVR